MSIRRPAHHRRATDAAVGSRSVRWRLWAAMLALALVPTLAGIYLTTSLLDEPNPDLATLRAQLNSEAAADLRAQEAAVEARLLVAADDPGLARLADGIDGDGEKETAARIVRTVRGGDPSVVTGICFVRASDGKRIPLSAGRGGLQACADSSLRQRAATTAPEVITRFTSATEAGARLRLATPTRAATGRDRGLLSADVDVAALLERSRTPGGDAITSMLVDMGSSEVVATATTNAGSADGETAFDQSLLRRFVADIVRAPESADERLSGIGLASTIVPLWHNGDGTRTGFVQFWPRGGGEWPLEVRLILMAMLAGAIVAVIVLVRYFLAPFQEMAQSREELEELYREARKDALADGLTSLGNHRAFQEELARQIKSFRDRGLTFSLALLDLDDLKVVNDREGHAAGDELLVSMARNMREFARAGDHVYRTGGDEFAMILPRTTIEDAVGVIERILHFSKRPERGGRACPFSAGISGVPYFTHQRDMVYRQADAALYWAKRHGRGSVEVFEPERDRLPDELIDANADAVAEIIAGKLLRPVFQPIVDLRTGHILGFEGLIRPDPDGPLPDTNRLFAAAAAAGRTVELDLACLEAVIDAARAIGPDRLLTLNLSPRTLEVQDFDPAWLLSGLVRSGISPSRVIIELTEREEIDDLGHLQQVFHLLQQYGLRLAADDVGAGNSGLRLLSQVSFDIVKVDLALVQSGVRRMGARAVLESLRDLAVSQNARMIAEGVETSRQLQVLREMHIGAAQGFLLGRPDASVAMTHVDVQQLERGVLVPSETPPVELWASDMQVDPEAADVVPDERGAVFLPPARRVLETELGPA